MCSFGCYENVLRAKLFVLLAIFIRFKLILVVMSSTKDLSTCTFAAFVWICGIREEEEEEEEQDVV